MAWAPGDCSRFLASRISLWCHSLSPNGLQLVIETRRSLSEPRSAGVRQCTTGGHGNADRVGDSRRHRPRGARPARELLAKATVRPVRAAPGPARRPLEPDPVRPSVRNPPQESGATQPKLGCSERSRSASLSSDWARDYIGRWGHGGSVRWEPVVKPCVAARPAGRKTHRRSNTAGRSPRAPSRLSGPGRIRGQEMEWEGRIGT